jgi:hypothetical protein
VDAVTDLDSGGRGRRWWLPVTAAVVSLLVAAGVGMALRPGHVPAPPAAGGPTTTGDHPGAVAERSVSSGQSPSAEPVPAPTPTESPVRTGGTGGGPTAPTTTTTTTTTAVPPPAPEPTTPSPTPTALTVPDVMFLPEGPAVNEIEAAGLVAHVSRQMSRNQCYVIRESPAAGTAVVAGQTVELTVAVNSGPCEFV